MNEIDPDFEIEPELLGARPRKVVPTKMTLFMRRLGWNGQLAILCLICFLASRDLAGLSHLISRGRVISGFVVKSLKSYNDSEDTSCTVYYAASRGSADPEGTFYLRNSNRRVPEPGDAFQVTYLPDDPSVYRIGSVWPPLVGERRAYWIEIAFAWSIPYLVVVWMITVYYAQRRHLLESGIAEIATVRGRKIVKGDDSEGYVLSYTYSLSARKQRCHEARVTKALYDAYPVGRKFSVLVDPVDHRRSDPYFGFTSYRVRDAPKRNFL